MDRGAHFLPDVIAAAVFAGDGVGFEVDGGGGEAAEVDVDGLGAFVVELVVAVVVALFLGSQGGGAVAGQVVGAVVVEEQVKLIAAFGAGEKVAWSLGDDEAFQAGKEHQGGVRSFWNSVECDQAGTAAVHGVGREKRFRVISQGAAGENTEAVPVFQSIFYNRSCNKARIITRRTSPHAGAGYGDGKRNRKMHPVQECLDLGELF